MKTLISAVYFLLFDFLSLKTDVNQYLQKVISKKIRKKLPPDPALFISDLQDANKKYHGFGTLILTGYSFYRSQCCGSGIQDLVPF
jgi:hypothetical protein